MNRLLPALLLVSLLAAPGCASSGPGAPGHPSPRLHHLLDLSDARVPVVELEPFLRDPEAVVRARAALAVARVGGEAAGPLLRLAARDGDPSVREAAALGFGLAGDETLAGDAAAMLRRPGSGSAERAAAAASLVRLAGDRMWKEPDLAAVFEDVDPTVRRAAFRALVGAVREWTEWKAALATAKKESKRAPALPPWLVAGLSDGEGEIRASTCLALRSTEYAWKPRLTKEALPDDEVVRLLPGLITGDPDVDTRAAAALAIRGEAADVAALLVPRLLRDEAVPRVRVNLARTLGRTGGDEARAALLRVLADDPDFSPRAAAAAALGGLPPEPETAKALHHAAADDASVLVRVEALGALHALGGPWAETAARAAAGSPSPFVRAAAAGAAANMHLLQRLALDDAVIVREAAVDAAGSRGREGFAVCLQGLNDADPVVAAIAAGALGTMGARETVDMIEKAYRRFPAPAAAPDPGADLRAAALEALGALDRERGRALAETALGDPDPSVRATAAALLTPEGGAAPELPVPPRLRPFPGAGDLLVEDAAAPLVEVTTDRGSFTVRLFPSAAPVHVARFLERVRQRGYDDTAWHRIVPNFVVQGGDPRGDGSGNGGASIREEFSSLPYLRGTLGVPRSSPPESGGCQLFFCHGSTPHLDRNYTIIGRVEEGFEVLDRIDLGDRIRSIRIQ